MSCFGRGERRSLQKDDTSSDLAVSGKAIEEIIASYQPSAFSFQPGTTPALRADS
jgi:hypothetical protein